MTDSIRQSLVLVALGLLTSLALALPTPKDISQAVAAGKLADAEKMLQEVIAEKPGSAKAHYELGEVLAREGRYTEALSEMERAKSIDPTLHFALSPEKFNEVFASIHQAMASQAAASPKAGHSSVATTNGSVPTHASETSRNALGSIMPWGVILLVLAGLLLLFLWRRRPSSLTPTPNPMPMQAAAAPQGFGPQYNPGGPVYAPTSGTGSNVAGAVVGGLAGVAAGYALSKALEGRDHTSGQTVERSGDDGFIPINQTAAPGVSQDLGSFDQGSGGNDWDSTSSSQDDESW